MFVHSPTAVPARTWRALDRRLADVPLTGEVPGGERAHWVHDGMAPLEVETGRHGILVSGHIWVLDDKGNTNRFPLRIQFHPPRFHLVESLTSEAIALARLLRYELVDEVVQADLR